MRSDVLPSSACALGQRDALGQLVKALLPPTGHDDIDALLGVALRQRLAEAAGATKDGHALLCVVSERTAAAMDRRQRSA